MNADEVLREQSQSRRRRCTYCRETFDRDDRRSVRQPGRGSSGWFCSEECLRRWRRQAVGNQVEPYYGEQLDHGFRMLHASESGEW